MITKISPGMNGVIAVFCGRNGCLIETPCRHLLNVLCLCFWLITISSHLVGNANGVPVTLQKNGVSYVITFPNMGGAIDTNGYLIQPTQWDWELTSKTDQDPTKAYKVIMGAYQGTHYYWQNMDNWGTSPYTRGVPNTEGIAYAFLKADNTNRFNVSRWPEGFGVARDGGPSQNDRRWSTYYPNDSYDANFNFPGMLKADVFKVPYSHVFVMWGENSLYAVLNLAVAANSCLPAWSATLHLRTDINPIPGLTGYMFLHQPPDFPMSVIVPGGWCGQPWIGSYNRPGLCVNFFDKTDNTPVAWSYAQAYWDGSFTSRGANAVVLSSHGTFVRLGWKNTQSGGFPWEAWFGGYVTWDLPAAPSGIYNLNFDGNGNLIYPAYTLSLVTNGNGSVFPTITNGHGGDRVTIRATPSPEYAFKAWTVDDAGGGSISSPMENPAIFTFGNTNAAITASFVPIARVYNLRAQQRKGSKIVEIRYDLEVSAGVPVDVICTVSSDGGSTFAVPANSFRPAAGSYFSQGTDLLIEWDAGQDWDNHVSSHVVFQVLAGGNSSAISPSILLDTRDGVPPDNSIEIRGSQPTFQPNSSSANPSNLIILVHGANDSPMGWPTNMYQQIITKVTSDYLVAFWDWSKWAKKTLPILKMPMWWTMDYAEQSGRSLANQIITSDYSHVHLIGHSLGGRVIQTAATETLKAKPTTSIHLTFLDGYTTLFRFWETSFGKNSTYAEHYYNSNDYPETDRRLKNAFNVDITRLRGEGAVYDDLWNPIEIPSFLTWLHGWPCRWYEHTIVGYNPANTVPGYWTCGFSLSKEFGNVSWASETPATHLPGRSACVSLPVQSKNSTDSKSQGVELIRTLSPATVLREELLTIPASLDVFETITNIHLNKQFGSSEGNVLIRSNSLFLTSLKSTSWASFKVSADQTATILKSSFAFHSPRESESLLEVYLDNQLIAFYFENTLATKTDLIYIDLPNPINGGTHLLTFCLSSTNNVEASLDLSSISLGKVVSKPHLNLMKKPNGEHILTWWAVSGTEYVLQYNNDLDTSNWINLKGPFIATNTTMSFVCSGETNKQRFYKLIALP